MLTTGQVSNARDLEELVVGLHGTGHPMRRRDRVVVAEVLGLGLDSHRSRAGGCRGTRLHRHGLRLGGCGWRELRSSPLMDCSQGCQGTFGWSCGLGVQESATDGEGEEAMSCL